MAATTTTDLSTDALTSNDALFARLKFFVLQRLPLRSSYIERIEKCGGQIVKTESQADVVLADHMRKDVPDGSLSYTFVDEAIKTGQLPEAHNHVIRTVQPRPVGSASIPAKATRTAFTREDDLYLWNWVKKAGEDGQSIKGNDVYKDLGDSNHRHTWQSWRDRYVKILAFRPPAEPPADGSVTTASATRRSKMRPRARETNLRDKINKRHTKSRKTPEPDLPDGYTEEEIDKLVQNGEDIANVDADQRSAAWSAWAESELSGYTHTAEEWAVLWDYVAKPRYKRMKAERKQDSQARKQAMRNHATETKVTQERSPTDEAATKANLDPTPESAIETVREPAQVPFPPDGTMAEVVMTVGGTIHGGETAPSKRKSATDGPDDQERAKRARTEQTSASTHIQPKEDAAARTTSLPPIPTFASDFERSKRRLFGFPSPEKPGSPCEDALMSNSNDETMRRAGDGKHQTSRQQRVSQELEVEQDRDDRVPQLNQRENSHSQVYKCGESEVPSIGRSRLNLGAHTQEQDNELQNGVTRGFHATEEEDVDLSDHGSGLSLTEANLATHREQSREKPSRARDLAEDDENQDQTDFVEYLQQATRAATAQPNGTLNRQKVPLSGLGGAPDVPDLGMPMLSDQDIDDVFGANTTWPFSPEAEDIRSTPQVKLKPTKRFSSNMATIGDDERSTYGLFNEQRTSSVLRHDEDCYESKLSGADEDEVNFNVPSPEEASQPVVPPQPAYEASDDRRTNFCIPTAREEGVEQDVEAGRRQVSTAPSVGQMLPGQVGENPQLVSTALSLGEDILGMPPSSTSSSPYASPVMSRPQPLDTQAILNMETQPDEFDMPLSGSPTEGAFDMPLPPGTPDGTGMPMSLESPDDLRMQRPSVSPDHFNMPFPSSSPEDANAFQKMKQAHLQWQRDMSTPSRKHEARLKVESQSAMGLGSADVDEYITTLQVREGYDEADIVEALHKTSMRPELAELALAEHAAGRGWPEDVPGIWSNEEDGVVMGRSGEASNEVAKKMTWDEVLARIAFLEKWQEAVS